MASLRLILPFIILTLLSVSAFPQRTGIFQIQYNIRETDSLLNLLKKTNNDTEKVYIYKALTWKLRNTNAEQNAILFADKGIELAQKLKLKKLEADLTRFKGMINWNFFHENITYDLYNKALSLSREIGDKEGEAFSCDRLGVTYFYNQEYEKAIQYFEKAKSLFEKLNNYEGLGYVYSHLNWLYSSKKEFKKAIEAGYKALNFRMSLKNYEGISNSYADLGQTYKNHNPDSTLKYLEMSVRLAREKHLELPLAEHTTLLSDVYFQSKNYEKALQYASESYSLAYKNSSKRQMEKTAKVIADIYELQHNYKKALGFLHVYHNIKDSLFNEEINKKIVEQELQYNYEKEKQVAIGKARLTKVTLTAIIILLVVIAVIIFMQNRVTQVVKMEKLRRKISSDLHDDIGATLSSINIYAELAKSEQNNLEYINAIQQHAQSTVDSLDDLVWSINPNNDKLGVLVDRMQSYALPLLIANKIKTEFVAEIKDEDITISIEKRRSIYFAFKEMIANVLKHGYSTTCSISVEQKKSLLKIEVNDNGKGFKLDNINQQRNGLRNLKTRAMENQGEFHIFSEPGKGTSCSFSVAVR